MTGITKMDDFRRQQKKEENSDEHDGLERKKTELEPNEGNLSQHMLYTYDWKGKTCHYQENVWGVVHRRMN